LGIKRLHRKRRNYLHNLTQPLYYPARNTNNLIINRVNKVSPLLKFNLIHTPTFITQPHSHELVNATVLFSKTQTIINVLSNLLCFKNFFINPKLNKPYYQNLIYLVLNRKLGQQYNLNNNLSPHAIFRKKLCKKVLNSFTNKNFDENITPWYYHTLIRFIEHCSGTKIIFQFYPFINQLVSFDNIMRYKK
jgi:hypothetical protein